MIFHSLSLGKYDHLGSCVMDTNVIISSMYVDVHVKHMSLTDPYIETNKVENEHYLIIDLNK